MRPGLARAFRQALFLILTAACALGLTLAAWLSARNDAEAQARARFDLAAAEVVLSIKGRMLDYEQVLRGASGLFAASESVESDEWAAYVAALRIEVAYPGIRSLGYAPYTRSPGAEARVPVVYLEPLDEANRRALGFDMYGEPARRAAMERARDTGVAVITPALTLAQDAGTQIPGFVMYLPVYRNGAEAENIAQRSAALAGFVYAQFRFGDLIAGSVGGAPGLDLRLLDVAGDTAPMELYRSAAAAGRRDGPRFTRSEYFRVAQRAWRMEAASLPAMEAGAESNLPALVLASGLAITALLMLVVWSLSTTRERARELAQHMTAALRTSEQRLQLALASSRLALFDWDVDTGLVQLSAEWTAMLGGERAPALSPIQKLQLLDHPDDAATVRAKVGALLSGESEGCRYEHRVRRLDGSWLWIETVARANERHADGRARRITGANSDIEARKAVERMKNEFIATVNHELRSPITSVLGSLGLVRSGRLGALPSEAQKLVELAYANSERLIALVNDILDIERIEAGRMDVRLEQVDLAALLPRAIELNAAYAERLGVRLELAPKAGASAVPVRADPDRLMQVLTNLLSNAAKYSPRGGAVTLAAADAGKAVRISVSDNGPGIPPEFRERLFGKFEQADRAHGGTGLGLAISKALVERMEGGIGCDSEPGRGSTFWVELPKA
jgi:PAS domain S-box-containing protein